MSASGFEEGLEAYRADMAVLEAEQAQQQSALTSTFDAKRQRDMANLGNDPVEIWGPDEGQVCADFLEFMGKHSFKGAVQLEYAHEGAAQGPAYPIGLTSGFKRPNDGLYAPIIGGEHNQHRTSMPAVEVLYGNHPANTYLCADGQIRVLDQGRVQSLPLWGNGSLSLPAIGSVEVKGEEKVIDMSSNESRYPHYVTSVDYKTFVTHRALRDQLIHLAAR